MLNAGIIGIGEIGVTHAVIFNMLQGSRTKAICDKDILRVKVARKIFPEVTFYTNSNKMIANEDLDLVVVATPTPTHHILVPNIVKANPDVSILVEKPLAIDYIHALELVALQKKFGGVFSVGYQKRFSGTFRKAKLLLQNGAIGKIIRFRSSFFTSAVAKTQKGWRYEVGTGGVTRDFGPHLLDLLIWYFGEPTLVKSTKTSVYSGKVEDSVHSEVHYQDGLEGTIDLSWAMREYRSPELTINIYGEKGLIEVTDDRLTVQIKCDSEGKSQTVTYTWYKNELTPQVPFLFSDPEFTLQNQSFLECVLSHSEPEQTFESAARVNLLIDQILNSSTVV